ncbi:MAG: histidine phosphatase family protein [Candidatus Thorarchaeota archaeon]
MSNSLYFLRHAETKIKPEKPVREWNLTRAGRLSTLDLVESKVFDKMEGIIHSSENKAKQTANILAKALNVDSYELPEIDELNRNHGGFLTNEEYRARVRATLSNWDNNEPGWESANDALRRFLDGVRRTNIMFHNKNILVVSHGLVLTLYFSFMRSLRSIAYERWAQLKFLSWGLVRENRVLIDIV